jgi:hypothetical protein
MVYAALPFDRGAEPMAKRKTVRKKTTAPKTTKPKKGAALPEVFGSR